MPTESNRRLGESAPDTFWLRMKKNCQMKVSFFGKLQVYWQSSGRSGVSEITVTVTYCFLKIPRVELGLEPRIPLIPHFIRYCKICPLKSDITL